MLQFILHLFKTAAHNLQHTLRRLDIDIALAEEPLVPRDRILGLSDSHYTLLVPNTGDKVRFCILAESKLNLIISPFFCTGDVANVIYKDDPGTEPMLSSIYIYISYEKVTQPGRIIRIKENIISLCQCPSHPMEKVS